MNGVWGVTLAFNRGFKNPPPFLAIVRDISIESSCLSKTVISSILECPWRYSKNSSIFETEELLDATTVLSPRPAGRAMYSSTRSKTLCLSRVISPAQCPSGRRIEISRCCTSAFPPLFRLSTPIFIPLHCYSLVLLLWEVHR